MLPNLARLAKNFNWKDSHRTVSPHSTAFSHYYKEGATRIDREYSWGEISTIKSEYVPLAFSDHLGLLTEVKVPFSVRRQKYKFGPKTFKIRNNIACDSLFKQSVAEEMVNWKEVKNFGLDTLTWWELIVKPGLKRIAVERDREIKSER